MTETPTASTPRVTPTASMPVRIPWGDWLDQFIAHEAPIIKAAAEGGVALALHEVPMGFLLQNFIGPKIVDQYVDMGLSALHGVLHPLGTDVPSNNGILTTIANLIVTNEPKFATWVGGELEPMIKAGLSKVGIPV